MIIRSNDGTAGKFQGHRAVEHSFLLAIWKIAPALLAGAVRINDNLQNAPHIPFAGAMQSGYGVENGMDGLHEYVAPKTLFIPKAKAG